MCAAPWRDATRTTILARRTILVRRGTYLITDLNKVQTPLHMELSRSSQTRCPVLCHNRLTWWRCISLAIYLNLTSIKFIWQIKHLKITQTPFFAHCWFFCRLSLLLSCHLLEFLQIKVIQKMCDTASIYSENYGGPSPWEGGVIRVFKHSPRFQTQQQG